MLQSAPVRFAREVMAELRKVVWPTKEQVVRLTLVVLGVSLVAGLFLGGLDFIFAKLLALII